jgi:hypothetical protein
MDLSYSSQPIQWDPDTGLIPDVIIPSADDYPPCRYVRTNIVRREGQPIQEVVDLGAQGVACNDGGIILNQGSTRLPSVGGSYHRTDVDNHHIFRQALYSYRGN